MDRNVKYLIIGAGISGLTFANYADGDYLIIEWVDIAVLLRRKIMFVIMQGISSILVQMNSKRNFLIA